MCFALKTETMRINLSLSFYFACISMSVSPFPNFSIFFIEQNTESNWGWPCKQHYEKTKTLISKEVDLSLVVIQPGILSSQIVISHTALNSLINLFKPLWTPVSNEDSQCFHREQLKIWTSCTANMDNF